MKQKIKVTLQTMNGSRHKFSAPRQFEETLMSDFQLIKKQRAFLNFYKNNVDDLESLNGEECSLVIVANFQPEATSFPEKGRAYSHVFLLSHLRSIGYSRPIYYKEHWGSEYYIEGGPPTKFITAPSRVGMNRSVNYGQTLLGLGCKFIPLSYDLNRIENMLPVTLTGSIAVERALAGLTTIYTGNPWWKGLPGTVHLADLGGTFKKIPLDWCSPNAKVKQDAKAYLFDLLNEKTVENILGIGVNNVKSQTEITSSEFQKLLTILHEN